MKYEFECNLCNGRGDTECECCGSVIECEHCEGARVDPDVVDLKAFEKADIEILEITNSSWSLIEDKKIVGREYSNNKKLYYRDFLITQSKDIK